jgi:hypothetical protein
MFRARLGLGATLPTVRLNADVSDERGSMRLRPRVLICLLLLTPGCAGRSDRDALPVTAAEPAPIAERFAGYYEAGWEREVFRPCGVQEDWWSWSTGKIIQEDPRGWGRVFVVLEGTVSPPGSYGHLGRYPRQIVITEVIEVRPAESAACPESI